MFFLFCNYSYIISLIHNPDYLLIDEPFVGLDPNRIKEFREMLHSIKLLKEKYK